MQLGTRRMYSRRSVLVAATWGSSSTARVGRFSSRRITSGLPVIRPLNRGPVRSSPRPRAEPGACGSMKPPPPPNRSGGGTVAMETKDPQLSELLQHPQIAARDDGVYREVSAVGRRDSPQLFGSALLPQFMNLATEFNV